ncbi:MAG: Cell wall protein Awa1p, partial [Ignavibacteriaceae bacterium]|nr:Cell wall protein Awa1p [Ignavibacteriaceae bacterium]
TELKGNYYLVIYHRNHIPIMSSNSTYLDYVSVQYDFTNSQSKAFGTNPMKDLGGGYFGAYTGDTNGSGTVDASDRSNAWNQRNVSGYNGSDVNLSGTVDAADRSVIWNNRNLSTQVPN